MDMDIDDLNLVPSPAPHSLKPKSALPSDEPRMPTGLFYLPQAPSQTILIIYMHATKKNGLVSRTMRLHWI